ncbi:uncharacterized protein LOC143277678 [Babylonia areolata]|uniref:uncharacterized protein LOC143277678 n=1 Tax=Babylonia areolata TaxID=304850 RepID=UPI003FD2B7DB
MQCVYGRGTCSDITLNCGDGCFVIDSTTTLTGTIDTSVLHAEAGQPSTEVPDKTPPSTTETIKLPVVVAGGAVAALLAIVICVLIVVKKRRGAGTRGSRTNPPADQVAMERSTSGHDPAAEREALHVAAQPNPAEPSESTVDTESSTMESIASTASSVK